MTWARRGDACDLDGCHTACATGCTRTNDITACTSPFLNGALRNCKRCTKQFHSAGSKLGCAAGAPKPNSKCANVAGSFADQISAQRTRYLVDVPDFSHNLVTFGGQISGRGCLHQIIWCRGRQISGTRPHQPPDSSPKQAPDIWLRTTGQISPQCWAEYLVTAAADIWPT